MKVRYKKSELLLIPETETETDLITEFDETETFIKKGAYLSDIIGLVIRKKTKKE